MWDLIELGVRENKVAEGEVATSMLATRILPQGFRRKDFATGICLATRIYLRREDFATRIYHSLQEYVFLFKFVVSFVVGSTLAASILSLASS